MKTKEELNALKNEVAALSAKLAELTEEEIAQVAGGLPPRVIKVTDGYSAPAAVLANVEGLAQEQVAGPGPKPKKLEEII